ncbi:MAG: hypothetical protein AAGG75_08175 [Bacteroidota bacterium]
MWHSHLFEAFGILVDGRRPKVVVRRGTQLRTSLSPYCVRQLPSTVHHQSTAGANRPP